MTKSQAIQETEQHLREAIVRGYVKLPKHPRQTYSEYKADRRRYRMKVYQAILIGMGVLAAVAIALKAWVG